MILHIIIIAFIIITINNNIKNRKTTIGNFSIIGGLDQMKGEYTVVLTAQKVFKL